MKLNVPAWVSVVIGAIGAASAFLANADPSHAIIWDTVAGVVAVLVPVAHKAVS